MKVSWNKICKPYENPLVVWVFPSRIRRISIMATYSSSHYWRNPSLCLQKYQGPDGSPNLYWKEVLLKTKMPKKWREKPQKILFQNDWPTFLIFGNYWPQKCTALPLLVKSFNCTLKHRQQQNFCCKGNLPVCFIDFWDVSSKHCTRSLDLKAIRASWLRPSRPSGAQAGTSGPLKVRPSIFDNVWQFLTIFDHFRPFETIVDHFRPF